MIIHIKYILPVKGWLVLAIRVKDVDKGFEVLIKAASTKARASIHILITNSTIALSYLFDLVYVTTLEFFCKTRQRIYGTDSLR